MTTRKQAKKPVARPAVVKKEKPEQKYEYKPKRELKLAKKHGVLAIIIIMVAAYVYFFQIEKVCLPSTYTCPDGSIVTRNPRNSCEFYPCSSPFGPAVDYASFVNNLRNMGYTVELGGPITQTFIPVEGQIMKVNGEDVQAYKFASANEAASFVSAIKNNGTEIGTSLVLWAAAPHFYQKEQLVVLYVGDNENIQSALASLLGKQAAGAPQLEKYICDPDSRLADVCTEIYQPVCGWFSGVRCIKYPCAETYSNGCFACKNAIVGYYTLGECPQ